MGCGPCSVKFPDDFSWSSFIPFCSHFTFQFPPTYVLSLGKSSLKLKYCKGYLTWAFDWYSMGLPSWEENHLFSFVWFSAWNLLRDWSLHFCSGSSLQIVSGKWWPLKCLPAANGSGTVSPWRREKCSHAVECCSRSIRNFLWRCQYLNRRFLDLFWLVWWCFVLFWYKFFQSRPKTMACTYDL